MVMVCLEALDPLSVASTFARHRWTTKPLIHVALVASDVSALMMTGTDARGLVVMPTTMVLQVALFLSILLIQFVSHL